MQRLNYHIQHIHKPLNGWLCQLLLSLLIGVTATASFASEYVRIDKYLQSHPQQAGIMESFAEQVRQQATPLTHSQDKPVKIAVIYPALQSSDYWRRSLSSFTRRLDQLTINYELKTYFSRSSGDTARQSRQLEEALNWQPDFLVFTLNTVPQRYMIERILARGQPKLILQNITTPLRVWQTKRPFLYVGFDHARGTALMADWMLKQQRYQGDYLMLFYSPGYVSQMRGETFAEIAAKHKRIRQVAAYYTDGNLHKSYVATKEAVEQHPSIKMIFANSTDVALGALKAVRELGKSSDILINGWGGGASELAELKPGGLDVTVMRINDDNGIAMAEAIKLDLEGKSKQVPHIFSGDIELLPASTSNEKIDQLKKQSFRLSDSEEN